MTDRGLLVLADGAQAAFVAGVVASLARAGTSWSVAAGAGLGAQVAALAVLGEADEAERRWRRQGELGCPLLTPRVVGAGPVSKGRGLLVLPDAWTLDGWLDPEALSEHLAPEAGGVPARLRSAEKRCAVAVEYLGRGIGRWEELSTKSAGDAGEILVAAASFAGGWGPLGAAVTWGGVGAWSGSNTPEAGVDVWDVVCGFPVPALARPSLVLSLFEASQRRDELHGAARVEEMAASGTGTRVLAPTADSYRRWACRDNADLRVEWPLPWERNGELTRALVDFGAFVAG